MSRPEHGYALGVVAGAGRMRDGALEIALRGDGQPLLSLLAAKTASDIPALYEVKDGRVRIFAPLGSVAATHLGALPGDRENLRFPDLASEMGWAFLRGLFDASGSVNSPRHHALVVRLAHPGARLLEGLVEFVGAPPDKIGKEVVRWTGVAALDLLGHLYDGFRPRPRRKNPEATSAERVAATPAKVSARSTRATPKAEPFRARERASVELELCRPKHVRRYWRWCQRMLHVESDGALAPSVRVELVHPNAVAPRKERVSDSGYDLTLVYEKGRHGNVVFYGTGVVIEPPHGYYFDVVARSSIVKRGYMLANNVGIIDRAYRGEILVPLWKIDANARDLDLPARVAQLIPRPIVHFPVETRDRLTATQRGSGGFGSTG